MPHNAPVRAVWVCPWALTILSLTGCDFFKTDQSRFLSPEKVIKAPTRSAMHPIVPSLGPSDPTREVLPEATPPTPQDWTYTDEDYVIGPTDVLDVSILDLYTEGVETPLRREVSASGYIDLPQLPRRVKVAGLTSQGVKEAVSKAYIEAQILLRPSVSVTIAARRQNTYSVLGSVRGPGTFPVVKRDLRLLEALAQAGDVTQTNIRWIYIIRPAPAVLRSAEPPGDRRPSAPKPGGDEPPLDLPDLPSLDGAGKPAKNPPAPPRPGDGSAKMDSPALSPQTRAALAELFQVMPQRSPQATPAPPPDQATTRPGSETPPRGAAPRRGRWVYANGRWVRTTAPPASAKPAHPQTPPAPALVEQPREKGHDLADPFGWAGLDCSKLGRIIAIDLDKLKNGDARMNVVIRDNDVIHVPPLRVGEFYVMGEVARPGVFSMTGRRITIKQALAAAGNLGPLAWPENSVLIRRVGPNQEQTIPLNVEAICRGDEPDLYLKPDDVLAIGTGVGAPFAAVLRNAFRMTYGFGFIYDRNFADPMIGSANSQRFTRW